MAGASVVTGAFGYTGRHIAQCLLEAGEQVVTLTGHPHRPHPFGDRLQAFALDFGHPPTAGGGHGRGGRPLQHLLPGC